MLFVTCFRPTSQDKSTSQSLLQSPYQAHLYLSQSLIGVNTVSTLNGPLLQFLGERMIRNPNKDQYTHTLGYDVL